MGVIKLQSKKAEAPEFEEGQYKLRITGFTVDEENEYKGVIRPQLKWEFEVIQGPSDLETVTGYTSLSYFEGSDKYPPSKLYKWLKALHVTPVFDVNDYPQVDTDSVGGAYILAMIERTSTGWPKVTKILKRLEDTGPRQAEADSAAEEIAAKLGATVDGWESE
jgi:hypothetical protein